MIEMLLVIFAIGGFILLVIGVEYLLRGWFGD